MLTAFADLGSIPITHMVAHNKLWVPRDLTSSSCLCGHTHGIHIYMYTNTHPNKIKINKSFLKKCDYMMDRLCLLQR